jgi:hypothetical protein
VFNHSHHGSGVYHFVPAAGNHWHEHNHSGDGASLTDSGIAYTAQERWRRKTEPVEDRGLGI